MHLFSDASGNFGCGACWNSHWFQFQWLGVWGGRNITLKEIPMVLACGILGPSMGRVNGCSSCGQ